MNRLVFADLRNILATLYPDEPNIRRILPDAGIDLTRIPFGSNAINIWNSVLIEAEKTYQVDVLLGVVKHEYGTNQRFLDAYDAYRLRFQTGDVRRPIPDYLPYMVNRHEQEDELGHALRHVGQKPDKPVICLALGDEKQCHDMFIERLKRLSLPRFLGLDPAQNTVVAYSLRWPVMRHVRELPEKLEQQLAQTICHNVWATIPEINQTLAQNPGPVLLHFHLFVEDWPHQDLAVVTEFLHFWQKWPALAPGQHLFVCLCIKHRTQPHVKRIWRLRWRATRMQPDPLESSMAQVVTTVSIARFDRLICVPLPKLAGVKLDDVEHWARSEATQIFCRGHEMLAEIRAIFETWERQMATPAMPMERIAEELKQILSKYND